MPPAHTSRLQVAVLLTGAGAIWQTAGHYRAAGVPEPDGIGALLASYRSVSSSLPAAGRIGFLETSADPMFNTVNYYGAQHALAPRIVVTQLEEGMGVAVVPLLLFSAIVAPSSDMLEDLVATASLTKIVDVQRHVVTGRYMLEQFAWWGGWSIASPALVAQMWPTFVWTCAVAAIAPLRARAAMPGSAPAPVP